MLEFLRDLHGGRDSQREGITGQGDRLLKRAHRLQEQLQTETYQLGHYHFFTIHDPKERVICASSFPERVMHHAIMNVCHPYFDRTLIHHTHATRPNHGVYTALEQAERMVARYPYIVKLDVRHYFDTISHEVLKEQLHRMFKDEKLLRLFASVIDSYQVEQGCGLPIGNLTSQYFANNYLSGLDHACLENMRIPAYVRYMDDILLAADSRLMASDYSRRIMEYAGEKLHLTLKPPIIHQAQQGMHFLGYRIMPHRVLLSGRGKRRFRSRLMAYDREWRDGKMTTDDMQRHVIPLVAFTNHASAWSFRKACLGIIHRREGETDAPTA